MGLGLGVDELKFWHRPLSPPPTVTKDKFHAIESSEIYSWKCIKQLNLVNGSGWWRRKLPRLSRVELIPDCTGSSHDYSDAPCTLKEGNCWESAEVTFPILDWTGFCICGNCNDIPCTLYLLQVVGRKLLRISRGELLPEAGKSIPKDSASQVKRKNTNTRQIQDKYKDRDKKTKRWTSPSSRKEHS